MQGEHSRPSSFFGMIYEDLVPADHLLRQLAAAQNPHSRAQPESLPVWRARRPQREAVHRLLARYGQRVRLVFLSTY